MASLSSAYLAPPPLSIRPPAFPHPLTGTLIQGKHMLGIMMRHMPGDFQLPISQGKGQGKGRAGQSKRKGRARQAKGQGQGQARKGGRAMQGTRRHTFLCI